MADSTISQLPLAVSLSATDYIPVDQGGVTKRATLGMLGNGTVIVAPGKTLYVNNTITFTGTDGTTITFPATSATMARTDAVQSFTGLQTFTDGITTPAQFTSTIATGTAPFVVSSTTPVTNLSIGGNAATATTAAACSGNSATATALETARTIDGVSFNGTANILVVAPATHAATNKTTPVDADEFTIWDSVSGLLNHVTWANIKATGKTYYDTIYAALAGSASQVFSVGTATSAAHAVRYDQMPEHPFRNRLINGDFSVSQINASAAVTVTAAAALKYVLDQWYAYCTGANVSGQRVAGSGQEQYVYQFTGAASVTKIGFAQRMEQTSTYDMNNGSAIIGVSLSNSLLTAVNYNIWYADTADTFGTLASPTRTLIATGTLTVSSTYTRQYILVSVPAAATTGIEIEFNVGAQTSGTWVIGRPQFEKVVSGAAMGTEFEILPYETQLRRCQRFLPVWRSDVASCPASVAGICVTTTTGTASLVTPVPTRVPLTGMGNVSGAINATDDITFNTALSLISFNMGTRNVLIVNWEVGSAVVTAGYPARLVFTATSNLIYGSGAQL